MTPSGGAGSSVTNIQVWGGEYTTVNVVNGANYTFTTCAGNSNNTALTLYNQSAGTMMAFNDDFCGVQSQINWTSTFTGVLRVLLDEMPGCAGGGTNTVITVTLNSLPCSAPTISTHPNNATTCPGGSVTFTSSAGGAPDSLRWFRSTDGGSTWIRIGNVSPYSGATTGTLTVNPASAAITGTRYRLTAYKCAGPQSANSNAAILTSADATAPTAICRNISRNLSGTTASIIASDINNGSTDNCGTVNLVSVSPSSFNCSNIGTNTVTLTINDGNGNTSTCTGVVTINDVTAPTAICQNITLPLNGTSATVTPANINNGSTDNCGTVNLVSATPSSFNCSNLGANNVTLAINDGRGNTASCVSVVTITDTTRPSITCPSNISASTNVGSCVATGVALGNALSTDNCTGSPGTSNNGLASYPVGVTNVTWTATDGSGNNRTCVQTVTVSDLINPTAVCQNRTVILNTGGNGTILASQINNGSSDNCGIATLSLSTSSFTCANVGTNTVTLTVTDVNGRTATCTATVTVQDNTAPLALCQPRTINLNASGIATITPAMVNNGSTDACGIGTLSLNKTSFNCSERGVNTLTLTVTDINGNSSTCNGNVTVVDAMLPTTICQPFTVALNSSGNAGILVSNVDGGSTDNCGIATRSISPSTFTCANIGSNSVTLTVTDVAGNTNTCIAAVNVTENTAPDAVCQPSADLYLDATGNVTPTAALINAGSADNCGIASFTFSPPSYDCSATGGSTTLTMIVTDIAGNFASCTSNVTIIDSIGPNAVCQNVNLPLNASGTATLSTSSVDNNSTDNCGTSGLTLSQTNFTCAHLGANTVTLTVSDINGNDRSCTATVTVQDLIAPTALCQSLSVHVNASGTATIIPAMVNNGSTDNCAISSLSLSQTSFTCVHLGTNNVTLSATDASSNTGTCSALVTVLDTIRPAAICMNASLTLSAAGTATLTPTMVNNGSSDNCSIASTTLSQTNFNCAHVGANTVTLTVTDGSGNNRTCTASVTVTDNTAPTAVCQPQTLSLGAAGTATLTTAQINNGSSDACGIATLSLSQTSFSCANIGSNTVTLTVTDVNSNTSTCTATVTVQDALPPNALCQPVTLTLNAAGSASLTPTMVNNGSNDNCAVASTSLSQTSFTCANVGPNSVTLTVTDPSSNSGTCTATVTVVDNTAPVAVCQSTSLTLNASGTASLTAATINNGSSDACGIGSLSLSQTSFTCANVGANTVTLTVTDVNSNSSTCTASVTVTDNTAPAAVCQPVTLSLGAAGTTTLTTAQVNNGSSDACGIASLSLSQTSFTCANIGSNTVTLTVSDVNSNSSTCTATITVQDVMAPSAVCQPVTLTLNGSGTASLTPTMVNNGSSDNCAIASTTLSQTSFTCANTGSNTVTLTVTDGSSNSSTCTATITVQDVTAPSALCQNVTLALNASGTASLTPTMVNNGSADNCAIASTTLSQTSFTCANVGSNTVTLTVTDGSSNSSTCTATITVQDNLAPTAVCQPVTLSLNAAGTATLTTAQVNNGSSDNCALGALSLSFTSLTCADIGTNTVTLTVPDVNGNSSTCTATITVQDVMAPSAVCQPVTLTLNGSGTASLTPTMVNNGSSDNCAIASTTLSQTSFTCANTGSNTVTLTVTDGSSNSSTCTATITVQDVTAPSALCQNVTLALNASGTASLTPTMVNNGSADNCAIASTTVSQTSFTCANVGSNTVTLTVTDGSSNSSTCTATITVQDNLAPTAVCQPVTLSLNAAGTATLTTAQVNNGSSDNCALGALSLSFTSLTCADIGTNTVTLTVPDVNGNSSTCTATITVQDVMAPSAVCQPVTLTLNGSGTASLTPTMVNNGSSDNCAIASTTLSQTSFTCANTGPNTVTMTMTDGSSNSNTCTATITVQDVTAPSAVCQNVSLTLDASGSASLTPTMVNNGSADNCAIASTTLSQTTFSCANTGANTVTFTVTDASSNVSTCTATVTVTDNMAPTALCGTVIATLDTAGIFTLDFAAIDSGSTDNCGIDTTILSQTLFTCADTGQTNVTVTIIDPSGNSSSCVGTVNLPLNPVVASLNATVLNCGFHIACAGDSSGSILCSTSGGCSPYNYAWSNGATTANLTGIPAGTYTLTITDAIGRIEVQSFTLTEPPVLSASISGSTYACVGDASASLDLSASGGNACLDYSFMWSDGDTTEDRSGLFAGTYTVTVTDAGGCTNVQTATITAAPLPNPAIGANILKCVEDNATLTAAAGFTSYLWSNGATTASTTTLQAGTFSVAVTDSLGCIGHDTLVVTNRPSPANFITVQGPSVICIGDTAHLVGNAGFTTYQWSTGANTASLNVTGAGGAFILTVTDQFGCDGRDTANVTFHNVNVPNPIITPGPTAILCQGTSISLDAGSGYSAYAWSTSASTQLITVTTAGSYVVTVSNGFGCTKASAPVTVTQVPNPVPVVSYANDTLHVAGGNFVAFQWLQNGVPIPGAILPYYIPTVDDNYSVLVTDMNGCQGVATPVIVVVTAIGEGLVEAFGLGIYPNPTRDHLFMSVTKTLIGKVELQITDMQGRVLWHTNRSSLTNNMRLELPALASGMYLLQVSHTLEGNATFKFIVE